MAKSRNELLIECLITNVRVASALSRCLHLVYDDDGIGNLHAITFCDKEDSWKTLPLELSRDDVCLIANFIENWGVSCGIKVEDFADGQEVS